MAKTAFISHADTLLHVMDGQHPESPSRITAIKQAIATSPLHQKLIYLDAPLATRRDIERAHSKDYVNYIFNISPKAGLVKLDTDTAMGPNSLEATLRASGAMISAIDLVMQNKVSSAFCCVRPPGHHAGYANSAGFCIFNHVAIGALYAIQSYQLERVAIIDFDVHHGDGTEAIIRSYPSIMLCSTFQHPFYPYKGADTDDKHIVNIPLAAGSDGARYRKAFEEKIGPALSRFKPQLMLVSAGFDAHFADPLAGMRLNQADFVWITQFIKNYSVKFCEGRLISSLEGGYNLQYLTECVLAHIKTLVEND